MISNRIVLVGLGSIGRRHLANLKILEPSADIMIFHQHTKPMSEVDSNVSFQAVYEIQAVVDSQPRLALICSPAPLHVETAIALAQANVHLFIEKPLSNSLARVDELLQVCHQRSSILMVGYNFRFYPPFQIMRQALVEDKIGRVLSIRAEAGQYLPDWRPGSDYRQGVSARSDLGGGVVLELSHELDYVRWLVGEVNSVNAQIGRLSSLEIDVDDTAEIILGFANGAIGSVHLDMTQRVPTRTCRIIGTEGTLIWDGTSHRVQLYSAKTKSWADLFPVHEVDRNEMYIAELQHFMSCVREGTQPRVNGEDGKRVLEIALAAKQSSREQRVVHL
jgi:predicted dehydrogenase